MNQKAAVYAPGMRPVSSGLTLQERVTELWQQGHDNWTPLERAEFRALAAFDAAATPSRREVTS